MQSTGINSSTDPDLYLEKVNETYIKIITDDQGILEEISEFFSFVVPNAKFHPKVKKGVWDGIIRLFNKRNNTIYLGLLKYIVLFCKDRSYSVKLDKNLKNLNVVENQNILDLIKELKVPSKFELRDYQLDPISYCLKHKRATLLSPTSSGKSFIIYIILMYLIYECGYKNTLIIVPTLSLLQQMKDDFKDYGISDDIGIHLIKAGSDKEIDSFITISTWQSIYDMPKKYFHKFDCIIGDEGHHFAAKSLANIMENSINADFRIATTGTIDDEDTKVNKLMIEGLFGPIKKFVTTKQLSDQGYISKSKINCIELQYSKEESKIVKKMNWQDEVFYLCEHSKRNNFIVQLNLKKCLSNTIVLYNYIERHGDILYELYKSKTDRPVYYIHGGVESEEREEIRKIISKTKDAIVLASYGTFSTGINAPNLHDLIFASPFKGNNRNLQSIGRVLRLHENKDMARIWDLSDNFTYNGKENHTLKWSVKRIERYIRNEFDYEFKTIKVS